MTNPSAWGETDWRSGEAKLGLGACLVALGRREAGARLVREARETLRPHRAAQPALWRDVQAALAEVGGT
jgi:hypothetical protein